MKIRTQLTLTAVIFSLVATLCLATILFMFTGTETSISEIQQGQSSTAVPASFTVDPQPLTASKPEPYKYFLLSTMASLLLALTAGIVAHQLSGRLTRPIKLLQKQAKMIETLQPPKEEQLGLGNEIGDLARTIYDMAADLELQNRSVKYLAFHDPLTGLTNRTSFQMQLEDNVVAAANARHQCAVIYIDLDDFKEINDLRGHDSGDRALRTVANRINACLQRQSPEYLASDPILSRIGGDEFTILLRGKLSEDGIVVIVEEILQSVAEPIEIEGELFQLSASIGVAIYPQDTFGAEALFNDADLAMYASKAAGKGTYRFFDESMNETRHEISHIKSEFKAALDSEAELSLLYQPVLDITTGDIIGAEALLRWNHPTKGPITPDDFISIVEHNEIALHADLWVIEKVVSLLKKLDLKENPEFRLAANISASNLIRKQFTSAVAKKLESVSDITNHIQLELTERYLHRDEKEANISLNSLKEMGVAIWLDDFCTGYSSLNHLNVFPVDGIKIDKQLVTNIQENTGARLLVSAMIKMSQSFNIELIAEGVETQEDFVKLRELGCRYAQGYLFSKPVSEEQFLEMLETKKRLIGERDTAHLSVIRHP